MANFALAVASMGVGIGVLELGLRIALPKPIHFRYPQESYDFDSEIAHVLRPSQHAYTHDREVWINAKGQRGREFSPLPEPGVVRVLALGDSQTFGNGLAQDETWPKQLEIELGARAGAAGPHFEVVNGGIPGSDTWQHERLLPRLADLYHPQLAVLAFYVNDVSPRYAPQPARTADISNTSAKRAAYLVKRSALVSFVLQRLALRHLEQELAEGRAYGEYILSGAPSPEVESGWQQVQKSLEAMKRECEWRGIDFRVAVLPRRDQVSGASSARAYNERIAAITAAVGVVSLDLLPELQAAYAAGQGDALFIPWDGHNSAAANRVIARRLAQELLPVATQVAAH
jgi:lysophospholipase L1-like esterase